MFANRLSRPFLAILALAGGLSPLASAQSLRVTPFSLNVNFQRNSPAGNAVSRSIEVTNITTRVQVTTATDGPANVNWLFVNPTILNANEGATRRIDITILPAPLSPGTYTGSVRLTPDGGTALVVPVSLTVGDLRMQNAVPSALEFVVQKNTSGIAPQTLSVTATSGVMSISAAAQTSPTPWLLVDPGPFNTPATVSVSALAGSLAPGDYTGSVTLTATGSAGETLGNPTMTVPVRLRVVDDSTLTAAPTTVSFDYQLGGPVPAARTVAVSSSGNPLNFTLEVATPGTNVSWLSVTPLLGITPQNLSIGLQNLGNLPAGTFTGTVTIKTANNQTTTITVTLRVATDPLLTVTPAALIFTYQQGGSQPPKQTVIASNIGNPANITVTALGTAAQWMTVTTPTATTPAAIVLGTNTTNLSPGLYEGQVELRGNFGNSPLLIPVRLVVSGNAQPLLRVSQNQLNFAFQTGGATASLTQTLDVISTGNPIAFNATAANGAGWLTVTPAAPAQQNTNAPVNVSVTPGSLPPGVYTAQVSIQTLDANAVPIVVPVRMVISTQPLLTVTPSNLSFNVTGSGTTQRQTIAVGSTGTNFAYQATSSIAGGGTWLVIAQSGANTGSTVEVGVNPVVTEGSGLITITAPGIENSPVFVPVTLTNTGPTSQLTITPTLLDFVQIVGAAAPAAQTLDISLGQGAGLTNYRIADIRYLNGTGWLKLSKAAGIAPDQVQVSIDATGLQPGRYAATLPFESGVGNRDVVVFLEVRQVVTAFTVAPDSLTFNYTPGGSAPAAQALQIGSSGTAIAFTATAAVAGGVTPWLSLNASAATTPAVLNATVTPGNLAAGSYQGTITLTSVGGAITKTINVTLVVAAGATPTVTRMVNAASFTDVAAVPGMIVSFLGTNLGPANGVAAAPNGSGVFDKQLSNVKVIFDTFEAPLLFVSATQVNAIVPYLIAPRVTTQVVVEVNGVRSRPLELRVGTASPGIFMLNSAGQGAILNQDNTVNGISNPAARESIIVIYATGEGQTNPPGVDGTIPGRSTALKTPVQRVRVRIGGQEADVQYAGSAPFLVSGALQVNAKVPATVTPGTAVPIEIIVGDTTSPGGVTVAVR